MQKLLSILHSISWEESKAIRYIGRKKLLEQPAGRNSAAVTRRCGHRGYFLKHLCF